MRKLLILGAISVIALAIVTGASAGNGGNPYHPPTTGWHPPTTGDHPSQPPDWGHRCDIVIGSVVLHPCKTPAPCVEGSVYHPCPPSGGGGGTTPPGGGTGCTVDCSGTTPVTPTPCPTGTISVGTAGCQKVQDNRTGICAQTSTYGWFYLNLNVAQAQVGSDWYQLWAGGKTVPLMVNGVTVNVTFTGPEPGQWGNGWTAAPKSNGCGNNDFRNDPAYGNPVGPGK